ncbi:MAG TPA: hypothetical protein PK286_02515 [Devosia sp.]|nr:hypothetical protein [Devosia sp.]
MPLEVSRSVRSGHPFHSFRHAVASRLAGPGGFYNIGNALGLVMGVALQTRLASGGAEGRGLLDAAASYFAGNWSATALTTATIVFFWSGEEYHRALSGGQPDPAGLRRGDLLSGVGAVALGVSLLAVGDVLLAATAGLLHAAGKFGSAFHPGGRNATAFGVPRAHLYRLSVLLSRLPAIAVALLAIIRASAAGVDPFTGLAMPVTLLACYLLWSWADLLLFQK